MEPVGDAHFGDRRAFDVLSVGHDQAGAVAVGVHGPEYPATVLLAGPVGIGHEHELTRVAAATEVMSGAGAGMEVVLEHAGVVERPSA
ncbi:MAG: hypothetical protein QOG50_1802 [Actinomycetota bacterium]|nr:hypothetical protein [Actinomycetota bacterium]